MIIAIVNQKAHAERSVVARSLAVLRAHSGRKVCLVDTTPGGPGHAWCMARSAAGLRPWISGRTVSHFGLQQDLENLIPRFNDIVIDAGARDTPDCRCALIAAKLVLVPVQAGETELHSQYSLISRLHAARMFNPGLRVLFVMAGGAGDPDEDTLAAVRAYTSRVVSATLASSVLHAPAQHDYGSGRCVTDAETCDPERAMEMRALYNEVYAPPLPLTVGVGRHCPQGVTMQP